MFKFNKCNDTVTVEYEMEMKDFAKLIYVFANSEDIMDVPQDRFSSFIESILTSVFMEVIQTYIDHVKSRMADEQMITESEAEMKIRNDMLIARSKLQIDIVEKLLHDTNVPSWKKLIEKELAKQRREVLDKVRKHKLRMVGVKSGAEIPLPD